MVEKCVDGETYGALSPCPDATCGAKLKLDAGLKKAFCPGKFNDDLNCFAKCFFKAVRPQSFFNFFKIVR